MAVGFTLLLLLAATQTQLKYGTALKIFSILVWFLVLLNLLACLVGSSVAVPLVAGMFAVGAAVSVAQTLRTVLTDQKAKFKGRVSSDKEKSKVERDDEHAYDREGGLEGVQCLETEDTEDSEPDGTSFQNEKQDSEESYSKPHVSFGTVTRYDQTFQKGEGTRLTVEKGLKSEAQQPSHLKEGQTTKTSTHSQSNFIFLSLSIAFFMNIFWNYPFFLILLVPFAVWAALKRVLRLWLRQKKVSLSTLRTPLGWLARQQPILFPSPLPVLLKIYLFVDAKVLQVMKGCVDSLMSAFIITGLIVGGLACTAFLVLQIQMELTHYITMMAAVWNRTLSTYPQLME